MKFKDPILNSIDFNKELFAFLKSIFPDARAISKSEYYYRNKSRWDKIKASVIICPIPECNYRCIEHQEPLAGLFLRHLKKAHHITPRAEFVENLKGKISYFRANNRISYIDPFVHVEREHLFSSGDKLN